MRNCKRDKSYDYSMLKAPKKVHSQYLRNQNERNVRISLLPDKSIFGAQ